ncbi:MAG TPA: C25 family cysteine peptidase [Anaerolineae bacterium]|nr:C25 family cysteine peptidase [Anaerolineae bacterium]
MRLHRFLLAAIITLSLLAACRTPPDPTPQPTPTVAPPTSAIKLMLTETGLYRLTLTQLQNAGLQLSTLNHNNLALSHNDTPIPYYLDNDSLIFYGQAPNNRYTRHNPYILQTGTPGQPMPTSTFTPLTDAASTTITQTTRFEQNNVYLSQARTTSAQHAPWYWQTIQVNQTETITFTLGPLSPQPASLTLRLWGTSFALDIDLDHDLDLLINDQPITTLQWDGQGEFITTLDLPANTLQTGLNSLTLDNSKPGAAFVDITQLDWFELDYTAPATPSNDQLYFSTTSPVTLDQFTPPLSLFDITDPLTPHHLITLDQSTITLDQPTNSQLAAIGADGYLFPNLIIPFQHNQQWLDETNQADLIILSSATLQPALGPLIAARQQQGLTVTTIPISEIYDTFGHGHESPTAIQNFIRYAHTNWTTPAPQYLLLVGDATRDHLAYATPLPDNHIPTFIVDVQYSGETASDARLVDINDDFIPDMAVGRWPVTSLPQLTALVDRTLAYENSTPINQTLFAVDGTSTEFITLANTIIQSSQLPTTTATILNGPTSDEVATNWNNGAWLVTYAGHGSLDLWGKEEIFTLDSVSQLNADSPPPIVLQLTCLTGLFAHPTQTSLAEQMLQHPTGPVISIAATSLTLSNSQQPFAIHFLAALQNPEYTRIGQAFHYAKTELDVTNNIGLREVSDTFTLLGDPSAYIMRPTP